jgi:hypothetical protein
MRPIFLYHHTAPARLAQQAAYDNDPIASDLNEEIHGHG